jgi:hypothetical protein
MEPYMGFIFIHLPVFCILSINWCKRGNISGPILTYTTSGKLKRLLHYNEVIQLHFTSLLIPTGYGFCTKITIVSVGRQSYPRRTLYFDATVYSYLYLKEALY